MTSQEQSRKRWSMYYLKKQSLSFLILISQSKELNPRPNSEVMPNHRQCLIKATIVAYNDSLEANHTVSTGRSKAVFATKVKLFWKSEHAKGEGVHHRGIQLPEAFEHKSHPWIQFQTPYLNLRAFGFFHGVDFCISHLLFECKVCVS